MNMKMRLTLITAGLLAGLSFTAQAVENLIAEPSEANLKVARVPYQQTETYRFGNPIVDDWEGKVNAWPSS